MSACCAALLAGCTGGSSPEPDEVTATPREVPTGAEDRDAEAMRYAVAALDPCELLSEGVTAAHGFDTDLQRDQFTCAVPDAVKVTLYEALGTDGRFWQDPIVLDGVLAYRDSAALPTCTISIPVSFTHVITFSQTHRVDAERDCEVAEEYAAAAGGRLLADPTALRREDLRDGVIACDVFADVVGEVPDGFTLRPGAYFSTMSECGVWEDPDEFGFQAVEPESNLELRLGPPLSEWGTSGGWEDEERITIAGTEALVWGDEGHCTLRFDAWPAADGQVMGADLTAAPCDEAITMTERAISIFADISVPVVAVEAMVYAEGEPDSAAVGDCVHAWTQEARECAPALDANVPDDTAELVALGELDPNVVCAAAAPTVHDLLGDDLLPVTVLATQGQADIGSSPLACEFVRPDHALSVRVRTALEPLGYGEETSAAGHPAVEISGNEDQVVTQVALGDGTEPGLLELSVWVTPDRVYGLYTDVPIDRTPLEAVDELMERLATDLLG